MSVYKPIIVNDLDAFLDKKSQDTRKKVFSNVAKIPSIFNHHDMNEIASLTNALLSFMILPDTNDFKSHHLLLIILILFQCIAKVLIRILSGPWEKLHKTLYMILIVLSMSLNASIIMNGDKHQLVSTSRSDLS